MREAILHLSVLVPLLAAGQEGPCTGGYTTLPFGSCTEGETYVTCAGDQVDSVVWSNGQVGYFASGLAPGTYTYQAYFEGQVVQTQSVDIVQLAWSITDLDTYWMDGYKIGGWAAVPGCTSAWYGPCCGPQSDQSYLRLVQDGVTEMVTEPCVGCEALPCAGSQFHFFNVPTGHTYHLRLYDLACGQVIDDTTTIVAHACDNLTLSCEVVGTEPGGFTGAIHLVEAVPDPTEPLPLSSPVIGQATLYSGLDGWQQVGESYAGVSAVSWSGLDTGYYRVVFTPDAGCNQVTSLVHLSSATAVAPGNSPPPPALHIGLTGDPGRITIRSSAGPVSAIDVRDALGRSVPIHKLSDGQYGIGAAPPGTYVVRALVGASMATGRFIIP